MPVCHGLPFLTSEKEKQAWTKWHFSQQKNFMNLLQLISSDFRHCFYCCKQKSPQAWACGYNSNNILENFLSIFKKLFCSDQSVRLDVETFFFSQSAIFKHEVLYSYLNLESTKTSRNGKHQHIKLYSYLNLESTKTTHISRHILNLLYSYLNLESTKTILAFTGARKGLYSYLNLESTKTV